MLGAGLLALPIISADMGFGFAAVTMILLWALLTYTGLMLLEVCLAFPEGTEFQGIAKTMFGEKGAVATNIITLLLQYTLSASYISGASSTWGFDLKHYLGLSAPQWLVALGYTLVIAICVTAGANAVANASKVFFTLNLVILVLLVTSVEPSMRLQYLSEHPSQWVFIWTAVPVFMTSFGFHTSVPTVVKYVGRQHARALRGIFIVGGVIPLVAYLAWIFVSLGALPRTGAHSYQTVQAQGGTVDAFLAQLEPVLNGKLVPNLFYIFSAVVLLTSYLTVALALTDILGASIKGIGRWRPRGFARRAMLCAICFLPPFLVVVVYPNGFVPLLGVASIFCVIICMLFPAAALWRISRSGVQKYGLAEPRYKVLAGLGGFVLVIASSAIILVLQVLNMADALPQ
jgi:tyrosine-specific transport protein